MKKHLTFLLSLLRGLLFPLAALAAVLCFFTALNNLQDGHSDEGRLQLENALRRSAVACYAAEGIYPPSLSYLQEHYGVQIDTGRYAVFYDVFAENIMPDITVVETDR